MRQNFDLLQAKIGNAGQYQLRVFLATQIGYLCVTGSMLCTIYDFIKPTGMNCSLPLEMQKEAWRNASEEADFRSLLLEMKIICPHGYLPTLFSTSVMLGGITGAAFWGFFADRWGRKPGTLIPIMGCFVLNLTIASVGSFSLPFTGFLMFVLGFCGGGFMVTNLVTLLEAVGGQFWRLGATAFNGWPMGLMVMGLFGFMTKNWRWYHMCLGTMAIPTILGTIFFVYESPRWLVQHKKVEKATEIMEKIAKINGRMAPTLEEVEISVATSDLTPLSQQADRKYSYLDLVRNRSVFQRVLALFYSWLASSIISFGLYFKLNVLAGNRFLNTFLLGLFKGTTGVTPFLVNRWVGRKPILLAGATVACLSSWAAVIIYFALANPDASPWLTVVSVLGASAIDPIWKVNHLYSTELFPTVIRNMARAVCNVGSRTGSVVAPQVAYLRDVMAPLPYIIFGSLSVIHVLVALFFLPETKGKVLPDQLTDELADETEDEDRMPMEQVNPGFVPDTE